MAQPHPWIDGKLEGMSNLTFDLVTTLSNPAEAINAIDTHIDDAKQANDRDALQTFSQIRGDLIRHCDMLRQLITTQAKQGKF